MLDKRMIAMYEYYVSGAFHLSELVIISPIQYDNVVILHCSFIVFIGYSISKGSNSDTTPMYTEEHVNEQPCKFI